MMKTGAYNFLIAFFIFIILLDSCSSAPITNSPAPISTIARSPTSTNTPTITSTPTETPDPNKPADATGFDSTSGYYTKTNNGTTYYWIQIQINANDAAKGHWFASHMTGDKSIPLIDHNADLYADWPVAGDYPDMMRMNVYFIDGLKQLQGEGYLFHPDGTSFYSTSTKYYSSGQLKSCSFTSQLVQALSVKYTGHYCAPFEKHCNQTPDDASNFLQGAKNGTASLSFSEPTNTKDKSNKAVYTNYEWYPSKGYDVFIVNWDDADPSKDPTFYDIQLPTFELRGKELSIGGKLISIAAIASLVTPQLTVNKLRNYDFMALIFEGLTDAIGSPPGNQFVSLFNPDALGAGSCTFLSTGVSVPLLGHIEVLSSDATPTPPPTPTIAPTAAVGNFFQNLNIIATDSFDNVNDTNWSIDPSVVIIGDGVLRKGGSNWHGTSYSEQLSEGYGVLISFKYTQGSDFEMVLGNGKWNTNTYKRFGVYILHNQIDQDIWQGSTGGVGQVITGNLILSPNVWYSLLLEIGTNNGFYVWLWNSTHPAQTAEYMRTFGADWAGLTWTFHINSNHGTILFADFKEIQLK